MLNVILVVWKLKFAGDPKYRLVFCHDIQSTLMHSFRVLCDVMLEHFHHSNAKQSTASIWASHFRSSFPYLYLDPRGFLENFEMQICAVSFECNKFSEWAAVEPPV